MNKKSEKTKRIVYWVLTGLVSFVFLGSAIGKFSANEEALKMAANFGIDSNTYTILGIVEIVCLLLFIIPRTGILGTLILVAYMGGAIATHLEHGQSILAPCIIESFIIIVAFYRFPELRIKLLNSNS